MITEYHSRKGNAILCTKFRDILQDIVENIFLTNHLHIPFYKYEFIPSSFFGISYKDSDNVRNYIVSITSTILYQSYSLSKAIDKFVIYNQLLPKIRLSKGSKELYILIGCLANYEARNFVKNRALVCRNVVQLAGEIKNLCSN
uniref:Uncharacterized protein n=1 Tax=Strongyloides venezuelensis TaxID=75913 RepID=A0A0K0FGI0_STRVS